MLPVGVVIPTKNSMPYLKEHLENLSKWIDLVEQVVVVDSFSTDGTVEFIRNNLHHPKILFEEHPPGLYASWNHGIKKITSKFCYISTVGDSLMRAGLEHLVDSSTRLQCDVIVSRPKFVKVDGANMNGPQWPLAEIIEILKLSEPRLIDPLVVAACSLKNTGGAMTGSCASDLFLTKSLQDHLFPTNYGTAGDGPWSMRNALSLSWAITPKIFSTFRRHPSAASLSEVNTGKVSNDYAERVQRLMTLWNTNQSKNYLANLNTGLENLAFNSIKYEKTQREYNNIRKESWPWILRPSAWSLRNQRNFYKNNCQNIMNLFLNLFITDY